MTTEWRFVTAGLIAFVTATTAPAERRLDAQPARRFVLAAVFAHPDDEIAVAPLLARFAREGTDVYLVVATRGDKGSRISKIPAGDELGHARELEVHCSARRLGINPPVVLNLGDGELAVRSNMKQEEAELSAALKKIRPAAVITWGGEGLDGHPDHRMVGDLVTQIIQGWSPGEPPALYYPGIPPLRMAAAPDGPFTASTLDRFLTVRIPFEPRDLAAGRSALDCHETQYTPAERQQGYAAFAKQLDGHVYLRPAFAREAPRTDIR